MNTTPNQTALRCVADTNVLLASERSTSPKSPNREIRTRWLQGEFALLVSDDILLEYNEKFHAHQFTRAMIVRLLGFLFQSAEFVPIATYHLRYYPADSDDIAFLLCAVNGAATHLVSYDAHLLEIAERTEQDYSFKTCQPLDFLRDLRSALQSNS